MKRDNNEIDKAQNDAFTGQSATKESADPENLRNRWYEIEEDYRKTHTDVTDSDVVHKEGQFHETIARLARRRGKSSKEIREEIRNW